MSRRRYSFASRAVSSLLAALLVWGVVAGGMLGLPVRANAATDSERVTKALDYLHACQNTDGGFAEKDAASSEALTAWAIIAIASAGEDPNAWKVKGVSPVQYLSKRSASWKQTTDVARTVLAAVAARKNPRDFGGVDLVGKLRSTAVPVGSDAEHLGPYINSHIWAMIALKAAGEKPSSKHAEWLMGQQNSDGGWGWAAGLPSDSNDTAAALQALAAAGVSPSSTAVTRALTYLRARQGSDGGFAYSAGSASDVNSTAWVVQGLIAAGQNPATWTKNGRSPLTYLRKLQSSSGYVRFAASASPNPLLSTVQAVPALGLKPFPVAAAPKGAMKQWRPTVEAVWPDSGETIEVAADTVLKFSVADGGGTGVASSGVTVRIDGKKQPVTMSDGVGTVRLAKMGSGNHKVSVRVADRAGNVTTLDGWNFVVEKVSPAAAAAAAATAAGGTPGVSAVATLASAPATGAPLGASGSADAAAEQTSTAVTGGAASDGDGAAKAPQGEPVGATLGDGSESGSVLWVVLALAAIAAAGAGIEWLSRRAASRKKLS